MSSDPGNTPSRVHLRGFASMTPERRKEIAAMGGRSVSPQNRYWSDADKASEAGRKSVTARRAKKDVDPAG